MRRKPKPIVRACERLNRRYSLGSAMGAVAGNRWRRVEVVMHEVAHGFMLGLDMDDSLMSEHVSTRHERMSNKHSDESEIETCALEAIVLRRFNVPITVAMLANTAGKMMKTGRYDDDEVIERDIRKAMRRKHVIELAWCCEQFIRREARR